MKVLTAEQLCAATQCSIDKAVVWLEHIQRAMDCHSIHTLERQAAFLAQAGHESDGLRTLSENLNYSATGLLNTFSKYFTPEQAQEYARQPERIANRVYANRMGNRDENSGDGWSFRGGGIFQLTGFDDYRAFGKEQGLKTVERPDIVRIPGWPAAMSAAWEWNRSNMNDLADKGDIDAVSCKLNVGSVGPKALAVCNGLEDRRKRYNTAKQALAE